MSSSQPSSARHFVLFVWLSSFSLASAAAAESWSSPLLGRELVLIEKTVSGDRSPAGPLPHSVQEKLGPDFVEYESFVAARLPAGAAKELTEAALREGRGVERAVVLRVSRAGAEDRRGECGVHAGAAGE